MLKYNKHQPAHWVAGDYDSVLDVWTNDYLIVESDLFYTAENTDIPELWLEANDMLVSIHIIDEAVSRFMRVK